MQGEGFLLTIAQALSYIPGDGRSFWKLIGLLLLVIGFLIALWLIWVGTAMDYREDCGGVSQEMIFTLTQSVPARWRRLSATFPLLARQLLLFRSTNGNKGPRRDAVPKLI